MNELHFIFNILLSCKCGYRKQSFPHLGSIAFQSHSQDLLQTSCGRSALRISSCFGLSVMNTKLNLNNHIFPYSESKVLLLIFKYFHTTYFGHILSLSLNPSRPSPIHLTSCSLSKNKQKKSKKTPKITKPDQNKNHTHT